MRGAARIAIGFVALAAAAPRGQTNPPMNAIAEQYVKLVLAVGQHDAAYVDAYYGPAEWRAEVEQRAASLEELSDEAERLVEQGTHVRCPPRADEPSRLRHEFLVKQLQALRARVRMLTGGKFSFDEESAALYDAVAPTHPESYFQATRDQLDGLLPGSGPLIERLDRFRAAFIIPPARLADVFERAIAECRRRTAAHLTLPPTTRASRSNT